MTRERCIFLFLSSWNNKDWYNFIYFLVLLIHVLRSSSTSSKQRCLSNETTIGYVHVASFFSCVHVFFASSATPVNFFSCRLISGVWSELEFFTTGKKGDVVCSILWLFKVSGILWEMWAFEKLSLRLFISSFHPYFPSLLTIWTWDLPKTILSGCLQLYTFEISAKCSHSMKLQSIVGWKNWISNILTSEREVSSATMLTLSQ